MSQECVQKREQGIHIVERWPAGALTHKEGFLLRGYRMVEHLEIEPASVPFDPSKRIQVGRRTSFIQAVIKATGCLPERNVSALFSMIPGGSQEEGAAISDLSQNYAARDLESSPRVIRVPVLSPPENHIARDWSGDSRQEPAVLIKEGDSDTPVRAGAHQGWTARNASEAHERSEGQKRNPQPGLAFDAHEHRLPLEAEV